MATNLLQRFGACFLLVALPACAREQSSVELAPASRFLAAPRAPLTTYGRLSDLMQQGRTGPAVWLRKMSDDPSLVGIGALSGLRGEVAVVDGRVWLGYATGDTSSHGRELDGADETAAFLAVASVPEWRSFTLEARVLDAGLDRMLEALARDAGLDARRPLPVVIAGRFQNLGFHVADGRGMAPGEPISEKDLLAASSKGAAEDTQGTLVGFFSTAAHPAILHPGARHHLHVILPEKPEIGHVDHVDLGAGATVRLPVPQR
jgi:alpha-acetolactate decarboxylase